MRFFKENSNIILKLFINQIGIAIFSFFLYTIAGAIKSDDSAGFSLIIKVLLSLLSIWFYYTLIYLAMWELGAKDKIRIDGGKSEKRISKGLLIGICANLVNFIVWGLATLFMELYMKGFGDAFFSIFGVINGIFRIFCCMYLGVAQWISSPFAAVDNLYYLVQSFCFLGLPVITVVVTFISYIMGLNEIKIIPSANKKK